MRQDALTRSMTAAACSLALLGAEACSTRTTRVGGVMVMMSTDSTLDPGGPYTLHVKVQPPDGGPPYRDQGYAVPQPYSLPTSLAIASNGHPKSSVAIDVSLDPPAGGPPIDVRSYEVDDVPTESVVELDVVFSARCSPFVKSDGTSTCGAGETCSPGPPAQCARSRFVGADLPAFDPDAGPRSDEAAAPPVGEAGAESAADASADATLADVAIPDAQEGAAAGEGGTGFDAGCTLSQTRCDGQTPQTCDANGQWQSATPCVEARTHCVNGACNAVPLSCYGNGRGKNFDCGSSTAEDCCASYLIEGGSFFRNYDGVNWNDTSHPAKVSSVQLEAFEITVGRFRAFVGLMLSGQLPPMAGDGKHAHLNQGNGLVTTGDAGSGFETGWDPAWDAFLPQTQAAWDAHLTCDPKFATWTSMPGPNETRPINCISWYDAYAFCIYDTPFQGGPQAFLPTAAEWNYAAAGGSEQRVYAWGNQAPGNDARLAIWGFYYGGSNSGNGVFNIAPVGSAPAGDGKWGQSDLTGNLYEWTLDMYPDDATPCTDCDDTTGTQFVRSDGGLGMDPVIRGGSFEEILNDQAVSNMYPVSREIRSYNTGARCARVP